MDILKEINIVSILARLALAMLVGGILGLERGRKNRPAGFRTYMLVSVGATMVMMTNQYVFETFHTSDPVRMGAQVISGIGFLGAGTIIMTGRQQVKGITTAAGLWAAACIGLAVGIGFYAGAIISCLLIYFIMHSFQKIDSNIRGNAGVMDLYIEFESRVKFSTFLEYARMHKLEMSDLNMQKSKGSGELTVVMATVESSVKRSNEEIIEVLRDAEGVLFIQET